MVLMIIAAVVAYWIKGMCGFANTLVFTSILSFGMDNVNISPLELLIAIPSNLIMICQEHKHVNWRIALSVAAVVILGGLPGIFLLKSAGSQGVKLLLGALIIYTGIDMLWKETHGGGKPMSPGATVAMNFISGIFCGLYGIGALMAANIARITKDTHEARGTMSVVFILESMVRTTLYCVTGILTWDTALQAVKILPFTLLGLLLGSLCIRRVNERTARFVIIGALIVSGIALIAANL